MANRIMIGSPTSMIDPSEVERELGVVARNSISRRDEYVDADNACRQRKDMADEWLVEAVIRCRRKGASWRMVREATGISRQAICMMMARLDGRSKDS